MLLRNVVALVIAVVALGGQPAVRANQAGAPVLAVVDVQKVMRNSVAVKALNQRIEAQRVAYQDELRKKEEALRNADQELARQRTILSAEAFAEKRRELEKQAAGLQREVQERKRALDRMFSEGMARVQRVVSEIAQEIGEERGLDLVLTKATVVIVKPKFDITDDILKRLNERLPEVPAAARKDEN
jgi:Skp family chaperone for outer membrane proteins